MTTDYKQKRREEFDKEFYFDEDNECLLQGQEDDGNGYNPAEPQHLKAFLDATIDEVEAMWRERLEKVKTSITVPDGCSKPDGCPGCGYSEGFYSAYRKIFDTLLSTDDIKNLE